MHTPPIINQVAALLPTGRQRILVAPLDWGLGHATRCIPIIQAMLHEGHEVVLAGNGAVARLLSEVFPQLEIVPLPGYNITYTRRRVAMALVRQIPRLMAAIQQEHQWLLQAVHQHGITCMVSDNRYGLWHPKLPSILITHQLALEMPPGFVGLAPLINNRLRHWINRFSQVWVPDWPLPGPTLSGNLGHPVQMPAIPVHYIGPQSRFSLLPARPQANPTTAFLACAVLSGPEPQRTLLENRLLAQMAALSGPFALVRGLPGHTQPLQVPTHIQVYPHLPMEHLVHLICNSKYLVARSGYSTLMDAACLGLRGIWIPTPGQTEQQYLARQLHHQGWGPMTSQQAFHLEDCLKIAENYNYQPWPTGGRP
ncbi:MAG TPA: glycosyltransferase, partial [Phnomibacter sp.]|nr:glycosyltransferase [Phnomibacter sp.]